MPTEPEPLESKSTNPAGALAVREWVLVRYIGQPLGDVIPLPLDGLELGRGSECGICLPEPDVSRRHARLQVAAFMSRQKGQPVTALATIRATARQREIGRAHV